MVLGWVQVREREAQPILSCSHVKHESRTCPSPTPNFFKRFSRPPLPAGVAAAPPPVCHHAGGHSEPDERRSSAGFRLPASASNLRESPHCFLPAGAEILVAASVVVFIIWLYALLH
ncbi:unnamed protein product [Musa hybrid cultivar]